MYPFTHVTILSVLFFMDSITVTSARGAAPPLCTRADLGASTAPHKVRVREEDELWGAEPPCGPTSIGSDTVLYWTTPDDALLSRLWPETPCFLNCASLLRE